MGLCAARASHDRNVQMNVLYVEWGDDRILFDTGFGFGNNETAGWLLNQLETEGISRDSITKVLISHGHLDHVSGLIVDPESGAAFPNAEVYISQARLLDLFPAACYLLPVVHVCGFGLSTEELSVVLADVVCVRP